VRLKYRGGRFFLSYHLTPTGFLGLVGPLQFGSHLRQPPYGGELRVLVGFLRDLGELVVLNSCLAAAARGRGQPERLAQAR
jgi:hypothetical protein